MKPKRAVLLGGSGFIGRNLAKHLAETGVEACSLSSDEINLCDADSVKALESRVEKNDSLLILSAVTPDKGREPRIQMKNLLMGQTLCDFLEKNACAHVIYFSSDAVYDDASSLVNEASPCSPASFYGLTHLGRERMLAEILKKSATPFLILRPSILYGADDTHKSYGPNRFFRTAAAEQKITLFGDGEEKRDHVFIKDLSRLTAECLSRRTSGLLNIATGDSESFANIARHIQKLFEGKIRIEKTPRASLITHRHFDIAALIKTFPNFHFTSLEEGLAETFKELETCQPPQKK